MASDSGIYVQPDKYLVEILHAAELHFGESVTITSGYRCPQHNIAQGGSNGSRHIQKQAVDCFVQGISLDQLRSWFCDTYPAMYGCGIYNSHVHIDSRQNGPARWDYRWDYRG